MSRTFKLFSLVLLCLSVYGCAQNVWFKQNAGNGEFERDRYVCLQQSQQRVGGAQVNAYGGSAYNTVTTNEGLFGSCMGAKGWSLRNKEAAQNQAAQVNANVSAAQTELKQRSEQIASNNMLMCSAPELADYYKKTACKASDVSFEQLADTSKITPAQKAALVKQRERVALGEKEQDALQALRGQEGQKIIEISRTYYRPKNEQNNLDLYNNKITWGEYNKRRKEIYAETLNLFKK
jgi:hypothetical protein